MSFLYDWLRCRAAKRMEMQLPAALSTSYGGSEYYTAAQIKSAFGALKLSPHHIDVAFAAYLDFETYSNLISRDRSSYEAARSLFQKFLPDGYEYSGNPPRVNEYISPR